MHTRAASPSELMHAVKTRLSHPEAESQNRIAAFVPAEDQRVIPACSQRLLSRKCRATRDDRIIRSDTQSILPASEYSSRKNVHIRPFKAAPCDSQSWHRALFVNRGKSGFSIKLRLPFSCLVHGTKTTKPAVTLGSRNCESTGSGNPHRRRYPPSPQFTR